MAKAEGVTYLRIGVIDVLDAAWVGAGQLWTTLIYNIIQSTKKTCLCNSFLQLELLDNIIAKNLVLYVNGTYQAANGC